MARGIDERAVERAHASLAVLVGFGVQLLHRLANLEGRGRCGKRLAETYRDGVGDAPGKFPEEAPPFKTEDAAPHAVKIDGNNRRVQTLHDALETAAKGKQVTDTRDLSFGENANHFAGLDGFGGLAERTQHLARAQLGGDGDDAENLRKGLDERMIVDALEHEEANGPVGGSDEQAGVHERHVIRDEERTTALGDVVAAFDVNAIDGMREHPQEQAQQGIGHQENGGERRRQRHPCAGEENARGGEMKGGGEQVVSAGCGENTDKRKQVGGGDHAAFAGGIGAVLNQSVDGDGEEASEKAEQREEKLHLPKCQASARYQQTENRHPDCSERD